VRRKTSGRWRGWRCRFAADRDALLAIFDRPDNIPYVTRRGSYLYNYWIDANNPRGLWRRTTLASFRSDKPEWETILDLDALAAKEKEDWIWRGPVTLPKTYDRAMMSLSRGGGDAVVLREFDIPSKTFVAAVSSFPRPRAAPSGLIATRCCCKSAGRRHGTTSGYARTIGRRRGATQSGTCAVRD
jgi:prolyl oligopeptidase